MTLSTNQTTHNTFFEGTRAALEFLQARLGLDLWMLTRTEGEDWIVLEAVDRHYGVRGGDVFRWSDSFCSRMVEGNGPSIAPRSEDVPAYSEAPIGKEIPIAAYVGFPLRLSNGELFGTLCAADPEPQSNSLLKERELIEFVSKALSSLLESELKAVALAREVEALRRESTRDHLTGLLNRRGWDEALENEELRCRRYGCPACVLVIDLDNLKETNDSYGHSAGDRLIATAGQVLTETVRSNDVVARTGGDEFAVLLVESSEDTAIRLQGRIYDGFEARGISASIGCAIRDPRSDLHRAVSIADARMYANKGVKAAA